MDLKLAITVLAMATSVISDPVSTAGPKYVPVFVSSDAINQLNEEEGQSTPAQLNESGQDKGPNRNQNMLYGAPAPVYEHQSDQHNPSSTPQEQHYQNNQQPQIQTQYQQPIQSQQSLIQPYLTNQQSLESQQPQVQGYPVQQPLQSQQPQIQTYVVQQPLQNQQPQTQTYPFQQPVQNQQQLYQISQPAPSQPLYQIAQQPGQQAYIVAQQTGSQPLYGNQQQTLQQPLGQQVINQQPLLNQQQLVAQPIQTYQQPNQLLISQPAANQQTILTQPAQPILISQQAPLPNHQAILVQQPNQNGQTLITSNQPINLQPNNQNPGYIQNQNQNMYTVVPINGQNLATNQNVGTSTYLVPVQQAPNQVFGVNSG